MAISKLPRMLAGKKPYLIFNHISLTRKFYYFSRFTRANFLNGIGKRTPCFLRFSTVAGERGANDCDRDPRGWAVKFYTEEGNYDMVGNNTPVFFIRDPIKFPDFIHSQKRDPQTGIQSAQNAWDFWSFSPEALH